MASARPTRPLAAALIGSALVILPPAAEESSLRGLVPAEAAETLDVISPVPRSLGADPERAGLGRMLFTDTRLSRGGDRACITCHDIRSNGASAVPRDLATDGTPVPRNTPTAFNAGLSFRLGWAGDIPTLADQAELALTRPEFLGGSWPGILAVIRADPALAEPFRAAYGRDADREAVIDAINSFELSLLTPDSRFDRWLRGDADAISAAERVGYDLFRGIGCAACHQGANVGGNLFE
ncbi:cytochrome-c peroxidase, partial [Methylobacterium frigidaeris]